MNNRLAQEMSKVLICSHNQSESILERLAFMSGKLDDNE